MYYRNLIKRAISIIALANTAMQLAAQLPAPAGLECLPGVSGQLIAALELARDDGARLILSAAGTAAGTALRLLLCHIPEARTCGAALLLSIGLLTYAAGDAHRLAATKPQCQIIIAHATGQRAEIPGKISSHR
jgi:hypothetical protein